MWLYACMRIVMYRPWYAQDVITVFVSCSFDIKPNLIGNQINLYANKRILIIVFNQRV